MTTKKKAPKRSFSTSASSSKDTSTDPETIEDIEQATDKLVLFKLQYESIKEYRKKNTTAEEEARYVSFLGEPTDDEKTKRFNILISLLIGSQTRDKVVETVMKKIRDRDLLSPEALIKLSEEELQELIYPVAFYKRKSGFLKRVCKIVIDKYDGDIPSTKKELCDLPGVGNKMAYACMGAAHNQVVGICVDTHVHRISNLLEWVNTNKPEETRIKLEEITPQEEWQTINYTLVGFGQTVCKPVGPKCKECPIKMTCAFFNSQQANPKKKSKKSKKKHESSEEEYESEEESSEEYSSDDE